MHCITATILDVGKKLKCSDLIYYTILSIVAVTANKLNIKTLHMYINSWIFTCIIN